MSDTTTCATCGMYLCGDCSLELSSGCHAVGCHGHDNKRTKCATCGRPRCRCVDDDDPCNGYCHGHYSTEDDSHNFAVFAADPQPVATIITPEALSHAISELEKHPEVMQPPTADQIRQGLIMREERLLGRALKQPPVEASGRSRNDDAETCMKCCPEHQEYWAEREREHAAALAAKDAEIERVRRAGDNPGIDVGATVAENADLRQLVKQLRAKLQRVVDFIRYQSNNDGGIVAEIEDTK